MTVAALRRIRWRRYAIATAVATMSAMDDDDDGGEGSGGDSGGV